MKKLLLSAAFIVLACSAAFSQPAKYDADSARRIAKATPASLPQSPTDGRLTTDAQNAQIKGKVKVVTYRHTNDEVRSYPKKMLTLEEFYREDGNLERVVQWDDQRPYAVSVHGYLDGMRVSRTGYVEYAEGEKKPIDEGCLPLVHTLPVTTGNEPKGDERYDMREIYKYDSSGRVAETSTFNNRGGLYTRTTYTYDGPNRRTMLFWAGGVEPLAKTVEILDPKTGVVLEEWFYDEDKKQVNAVRWHSYEFDERGNWIVKKTVESNTLADDTRKKPIETTHRTITYYP
jgi:hypothetical protein